VGDRVGQKAAIRIGLTPLRQSPLSQFIEQRLGLFEVSGIEAFGKPAEDGGEQGDRLLRPALVSAQAGEAHSTTQFPGLRVHPASADGRDRRPRVPRIFNDHDTMAFSVARPSGLKWMCRQSKKRNPVSTLDLMQIFSPYAGDRWPEKNNRTGN
jgi:hypothetical protein